MFSLSTRLWDFARPAPPPDAPRGALPWEAAPFAKLAADLGATGIELDCRIPEPRFEEVVRAAHDHGLAISSLEALCPHPAELARRGPAPGLVPLANPDESERRVAVRLHRSVLERAADAGVPVVVLTLGRVELPGDATLPALEDAREVRQYLERRAAAAARYSDAARFALDALVPVAERLGRVLAIAMPGELAGVPSFQELSTLVADFRGAPLGAWLDTAAITRLARAGIRRAETWSALGESILGVRLTDEDGDGAERVPGEGRVDFAALAGALPEVARRTRVLSLGTGHDHGRIRDGLGGLRVAGWLP